jgi:cobalt-zinc-cadmium efflux system protein
MVIIFQALPRFLNPELVNASGMVGIAFLGILFNGLGFFQLKKGESINEEVLSWHLLEDVIGWVGILVGGVIIYFWNIYILDPILTVVLTVFVLYNVTKSLREALNILLQGVPRHINLEEVTANITSIEGVIGLHDLHIWSLEGETDILTAHVVLEERLLKNPDETRKIIKEILRKHHIEHSTIEIESKYFCSGVECKEWNQETSKNPK